jgi:hypothetical protein
MTFRARVLAAQCFTLTLSCVPRDHGEKGNETGHVSSSPTPAAKPSRAERQPASAESSAGTEASPDDPRLDAPFSDDFERSELGAAWRATSSAWTLSGGRLCGENARNHPVWLARRLPLNASIEFKAESASPEGDIKAEFWGDGRSSATGQSYTDATSYLTIFGGWKNQFHVLARRDEHAPDRREIKLVPGGADLKSTTVVPHRVYQFHVERRDGRSVRWRVDDMDILTYADDEPLSGQGHEHFGFNDWQVHVCFDDLRVTPL